MATVPGDPNDTGPDPYGGIPPGLRPGYPELLMAAAIHKQQQDQKLAGDVVELPKPRGPLGGMPHGVIAPAGYEGADPDAVAKAAMQGKVKVMTPGKTSMQFDPLDPKDDDEERQRQQQQKQKKKKSEVDGEMQIAGDVIQGGFPSKEFLEGRQMMQEELAKRGITRVEDLRRALSTLPPLPIGSGLLK
jgi:hypothetical protein